jgi:ParB-like nuclease domain
VSIIQLTPGDSPRLGGELPEHVRMLAEAGDRLPPIIVHRATMRVIDGMHRLRAAHLRGDTEIEVSYFDGAGDDEAFILAVQANIAHGLPLSLADRKAATLRILKAHPEWSDRSIGMITGLSPKTVGAARRDAGEDEVPQLSARVGRDGRYRSLRSVVTAAEEGSGLGEEIIGMVTDPGREPSHHLVRSAGRRRNGLRSGRRAVGNAQTIIRALSRDPSLRFTDSGRGLLRRLITRAVGPEEWDDLISVVPPHCVEAVTQLAIAYAYAWEQFAEKLSDSARGDEGAPMAVGPDPSGQSPRIG